MSHGHARLYRRPRAAAAAIRAVGAELALARKSACRLLASLLLAATALPAAPAPVIAAGDEEAPGVLSGPVEGMGKNRRLMPLPTMQVDPANASPDATPAERPLRPFSGWVGPRGCRFPFDGSFLGRLQDGRISGMAGEGANFDWPIADDGGFGGRLPLKRHESGELIFQWISGRVDGDRLVIDVEYGVPNRPDTFCRGTGITLQIGG